MRNERGFSLVGTMVAVVGIMGAAMATMFDLMTKQQNTLRYVSSVTTVHDEIKQELAVADACLSTFSGKVLTSGASYSITQIKDKNGSVKYSLTSNYDGVLKIDGMQLVVGTMTGTTGEGTLTVRFTPSVAIQGPTIRPRDIRVVFQRDSGTNVITACASKLNATGISGSGTSTPYKMKMRLFTSDGTFTVPDGVYSLKVTVWGAGGGYAYGYAGSSVGESNAGGTSVCMIDVAPAASYSVVIGRSGGDGGNSSGGSGGTGYRNGGSGARVSGSNDGAGGGGGSTAFGTDCIAGGGGGMPNSRPYGSPNTGCYTAGGGGGGGSTGHGSNGGANSNVNTCPFDNGNGGSAGGGDGGQRGYGSVGTYKTTSSTGTWGGQLYGRNSQNGAVLIEYVEPES